MPEVDRPTDPINRNRPLREQIYGILRMHILTGRLSPGGTLDEKAIAETLGVSRTPVREAVKKLSDEDLVEVKPQSGTRVATIERASVRQAFLIRRALESETVAAAARVFSDEASEDLERIHLLHERAIAQERYIDAIGFDDEFHHMIARIAGLPMLWRAIDVSKAQLDRCRYLTLPQAGFGKATLDQHRAIIAALQGARVDEAITAMRSHLESAYLGIERFLDATERDRRSER
ncbi:MAG: GntR family transcriptional regulator [Inquilinaceae bacterium]